jgi:hypothetical protein
MYPGSAASFPKYTLTALSRRRDPQKSRAFHWQGKALPPDTRVQVTETHPNHNLLPPLLPLLYDAQLKVRQAQAVAWSPTWTSRVHLSPLFVRHEYIS